MNGRWDARCVDCHCGEAREGYEVREASVTVGHGGLGWRVPRTTSDTHDDEAGTALRVASKLLRRECEDDGIADGFKEEEREEAADTSISWAEGRSDGEGTTCDTVDGEQQGRVNVVQENNADEAMGLGSDMK